MKSGNDVSIQIPASTGHSFAIHLPEAGCNPGTVQEFVGQSDAGTAMNYTHVLSHGD